MRRRKTTAADRTPSLFTGLTDLEDRNARDGSRAAYRDDERAGPRWPWKGSLGSWKRGPFDKSGRPTWTIDATDAGYEVRWLGRLMICVKTLFEASEVVRRMERRLACPQKNGASKS